MTEEEMENIRAALAAAGGFTGRPLAALALPDWYYEVRILCDKWMDITPEAREDDSWPSKYEPERDRHFDYLPLNLWDTTPDE